MNDNQQIIDRNRLFKNYSKRCDEMDEDLNLKIKWFQEYVKSSYFKYIESANHEDKILDIGCSRGYLLSALYDWGYRNLTGIDLSLKDISQAQALNPNISFAHANAFTFLENNKNTFDIIISKAVLEHIEKKRVFEFLEGCRKALTDNGILIIDVPNMDWIFASHERYMDFTHEVGFTIISLKQVMGEVFSRVETGPIEFISMQGRHKTGYKKFKLKLKLIFARKILSTLYNWADPEGCGTCNPIWQRSILGVGHK